MIVATLVAIFGVLVKLALSWRNKHIGKIDSAIIRLICSIALVINPECRLEFLLTFCRRWFWREERVRTTQVWRKRSAFQETNV